MTDHVAAERDDDDDGGGCGGGGGGGDDDDVDVIGCVHNMQLELFGGARVQSAATE